MSADDAAFTARLIPVFSILSFDFERSPAVSSISISKPERGKVFLTMSRVVPAFSDTIATSSFTNELKREDFPTLGLPTKTTLFLRELFA